MVYVMQVVALLMALVCISKATSKESVKFDKVCFCVFALIYLLLAWYIGGIL